MKKLLLLALVVVGGVISSNAAIYWCGGSEQWTPVPTTEFSTTDNETYTYDLIVNGDIWFAIADGQGSNGDDWNTFNNNYRYSYNNTNNAVVTTGANYTLTKNGDKSMKFTGDGSNYRFTFVKSTTTLSISVVTAHTGNADIESVNLAGSFTNWATNAISMVKDSDADVYSTEINLSNYNTYVDFKLVVNGSWLGFDDVSKDAPLGWLSSGGNDKNIRLDHANTHYLTYTVTATWVANETATSGWTIKIEGKNAVPKTTYTVTFVNGEGWDEVAAYVWNGDGDSAEKLEGEWPGKLLSKTGTATYNGTFYDVYTYSYEGYSAPEKIIFNNGKAADAADKEQTNNLTFTNGTQYTDAVVFVPVYVVVGSKSDNDNDQAFFPAKWTEASTSTDVMTYDATSGKWMQSIPGVQITTPASYKFKIAKRPYLESTDVTLYPDNFDITIDLNEANTYDITITFDDSNNNVDKTVNAKYETFSVTAAGWATAKTNNIVDFTGISGLEAYTATVSGSFVTLKKEGAVPAGTALVLKGTYGSEVTKQVPIVANADAVTNSLQWYAEYNVTSTDDHAIYGLTASNGEAEFTRVNEGQTVNNKALLVLPKSAARELKVVFADEANGIDAVTADKSAEGIFNLNGQRVAAPAKGLYIVNGKKIILK